MKRKAGASTVDRRSGSASAGEIPVVVRHDLWVAFVSTDATKPFRRYDKERDKAVLLEKLPASEGLNQDRFVVIEPIPSQVQKEWATQFANQVEDTTTSKDLYELLSQDHWFNRFQNRLKKTPDLLKRWDALRSHRVLEWIEAWKKRSDLSDLDPLTPTSHAGGTFVSDMQLRTMRKRLIRAIERMPPHELASIRIPIGYLFD